MDFLKEIKKVIEQNNSYPVKVGWGTNYHKMEDITEKFNDQINGNGKVSPHQTIYKG